MAEVNYSNLGWEQTAYAYLSNSSGGYNYIMTIARPFESGAEYIPLSMPIVEDTYNISFFAGNSVTDARGFSGIIVTQ